jgi:Ankyrin repeats (3 copies)
MGGLFSADEPTGVAVIDATYTKSLEEVKKVLSSESGDRDIRSIVNERDPKSGDNAMHIIARRGHYVYPPNGIPKLLIESGLDLDAKDRKGQSALEISLLNGWQNIATLLLDSGADRTVVTDQIKKRIRCPDCKLVVKKYKL